MQRYIPILLATFGLVAASAAHAQAADPDVRCLLVSNTFAQKETDPQKKQLAVAAVSFYLGRIDARLSPAQFKASVIALTKEGPNKNFGEVMNTCAKNMLLKQTATTQLVQDIAKSAVKK